ncbi:MAG: hypothetical protein AAF602_27675, partial [Myxococcota bacterium]
LAQDVDSPKAPAIAEESANDANDPGPRRGRWARRTLAAGLGIMGASAVGGAVGLGVVGANCNGECGLAPLAPFALGAFGVAVGATTALVGGIGVIATPRRGGAEIAVTFRF